MYKMTHDEMRFYRREIISDLLRNGMTSISLIKLLVRHIETQKLSVELKAYK